MRSLALTREHVEIQRGIVEEELRISKNQPYRKAADALLDTAYTAFPYKHYVLGSMDDLNAANMDEFQDFFKTYYAPNNATLVIVGDFKTEEALAKVKKYFEDIPAHAVPQRPDLTDTPQTSERRITVQDVLAQTPRITIAYKIPPVTSPDYDAVEVMTQILGGGPSLNCSNSSRLCEQLVRQKELATGTSAFADKKRGTGLATLTLNPVPGKDLLALEKAVYEEIAKLQREPVEDWELEKIRITARRAKVSAAESFLGRARLLADAAVIFGDAELVNTASRQLDKVTKDDIMRVARKYFTETNRTVVITMPGVK
jgi:predicted Zn-dependent peptidase